MDGALLGGDRACYARASLLVLVFTALAFASVPLALAAQADPGQAVFDQKCKVCHTIGGGRTAGPDLKGVAERRDKNWLIRFIVSPDQVIAQGDAVAKQLVQEYGSPMPNMGVSQAEAEQILAFIAAQSGGQSSSSGQDAKTGAEATPGDAGAGKELFTGSVGFANGGVACVSCHDVKGVGGLGGGSVGKDLTTAFTDLGEASLRSMVQTPPFPIMREAYIDHRLTDAEASHVVAFLQQASAQGEQAQSAGWFIFPALAVVGFIPILGLFHVLWLGRLRGVRLPLVKGGSK